jgi:hypothetical protein
MNKKLQKQNNVISGGGIIGLEGNKSEMIGNSSPGGNGSISDFNEEILCNICYSSEKNAKMVPCGHATCMKCI